MPTTPALPSIAARTAEPPSSSYCPLERRIAEERFGGTVEDPSGNVDPVLVEQAPCRPAHDAPNAVDRSSGDADRWRFVTGGDPYLAGSWACVAADLEPMLVWVVNGLDRLDRAV